MTEIRFLFYDIKLPGRPNIGQKQIYGEYRITDWIRHNWYLNRNNTSKDIDANNSGTGLRKSEMNRNCAIVLHVIDPYQSGYTM